MAAIATPGTSVSGKNILRAVPLVLGMFIALPIIMSGVLLVTSLISQAFAYLTGLVCNAQACSAFFNPETNSFAGFAAVVVWVGSFFLFLEILYWGLKFINLVGSRRIINLRRYKESEFVLRIPNRSLKRFMFQYTLHAHYHNWKEVVGLELNQELVDYIRSFYPEFEYHSPFVWGNKSKNFMQVMRVLEKADVDEINKRMPLFTESLRIVIKNQDNGVKYSQLLEPTHGISYVSRPFFAVGEKEEPGLMQGSNFEITIKYKGVRGYNFNLWAK